MFPCPEDVVQKGAQDGGLVVLAEWSSGLEAVLIPQRGCGKLVAELGFDQSCLSRKWK